MSRRNGERPMLFEPGDAVAILGLGKSGTAAARLLAARGAVVYASDAFDGDNQRDAARALRAEGIEAETGGHNVSRVLTSRLVVVSPGIDPATEVRMAIREAGVRTVAEVEVAFRNLESRVIAITGTNGKTTTTELCGHLLREGGLDALAAGNIGTPLSEIALLDDQPDWLAVELSSFQLADLETFDPDIGVLLNLAPDHLDRYATLESYYEDKRRLFANASDQSRWIVNSDDAGVRAMADGVAGSVLHVSCDGPVPNGAYLDDEKCLTASWNGQIESWLPQSDLQLVGRHNAMNAMVAGLAASLAGCATEDLRRGLRSFEPLPHRLQPVGEYDGVLWVNDSKGTNISATRVAVEAFQRPVVVLLGGRHKGESYQALLPVLREHARTVIAFGEAAPRIVGDLTGQVPLTVASSMDDVVGIARQVAEPGDVVLLSPACSSFDMYSNYAARGDAFTEAVRKLFEGNGSS